MAVRRDSILDSASRAAALSATAASAGRAAAPWVALPGGPAGGRIPGPAPRGSAGRPSAAREPHARRVVPRWRRWLLRLTVIGLALTVVGTAAIWTDTMGAGHAWLRVQAKVDRFLAGPVPDRPTLPTIVVAEEPAPAAGLVAVTAPSASPTDQSSGESPGPVPTQAPVPTTLLAVRAPLDLQLTVDPEAVFAHELVNTWCAPAGIQSVLAILGLGDTSADFQREIAGRAHEFEAYADAHDGGWGPAAIALALAAYGVPGYEVRAYATREQAIRDSAIAIQRTSEPAILLTWYGAHTWVMTGFRSDADPQRDPTAVVSGAYILDPWYPTISTLWGASDPPGAFHDSADLEENFLPWKRPEGTYADRDGRYIVVIPTVARAGS